MVDWFVVVDTLYGRTEAELIRSYLRARGVQCEISQEALGSIYGISAGPLGNAEILVPSHQAKQARQALRDYHRARHLKDKA